MASARSLILIASPSYFRSFEPILRTLRTSEEMPFQKELVDCESVPSSFMLPDAWPKRLEILRVKKLFGLFPEVTLAVNRWNMVINV